MRIIDISFKLNFIFNININNYKRNNVLRIIKKVLLINIINAITLIIIKLKKLIIILIN